MIYYEPVTIQDIAKRGAKSVARSDEARMDQSMGMATILSVMGAP